jgi:hypothetical protein|tara:strand:+ start:2459 stop:2707 length:249 start_codon:yes stop_codon:yes gene_type:complete
MGGSLTGPNKIKDVYKKIVFYDDNKLKIDNGSTDVVITEADNFSSDIQAGTGIQTVESNGQTTISVADAVILEGETITGGQF